MRSKRKVGVRVTKMGAKNWAVIDVPFVPSFEDLFRIVRAIAYLPASCSFSEAEVIDFTTWSDASLRLYSAAFPHPKDVKATAARAEIDRRCAAIGAERVR